MGHFFEPIGPERLIGSAVVTIRGDGTCCVGPSLLQAPGVILKIFYLDGTSVFATAMLGDFAQTVVIEFFPSAVWIILANGACIVWIARVDGGVSIFICSTSKIVRELLPISLLNKSTI